MLPIRGIFCQVKFPAAGEQHPGYEELNQHNSWHRGFLVLGNTRRCSASQNIEPWQKQKGADLHFWYWRRGSSGSSLLINNLTLCCWRFWRRELFLRGLRCLTRPGMSGVNFRAIKIALLLDFVRLRKLIISLTLRRLLETWKEANGVKKTNVGWDGLRVTCILSVHLNGGGGRGSWERGLATVSDDDGTGTPKPQQGT